MIQLPKPWRRKLSLVTFNEQATQHLEEIHRILASNGSRYTYRCRRGKCSAEIDPGSVDAETLLAAMTAPGLVLEECSGSSCREPVSVLPPPPGDEPPRPLAKPLRRGLVLGRTGGVDTVLPIEELTRHVAVVGSTGSGKSTTAARIAACASEAGYGVAVIDWHGEYTRLLEKMGAAPLETLEPVNMLDPSIGLDESVTIAEEALEMSTHQSLLLAALLAARLGDASALEKLLPPDPSQPGEWAARRIAAIVMEADDASTLLKAAAEAYHTRLASYTPKGELEVWTGLLRRLAAVGIDRRYASLFRLAPTEPGPQPPAEGRIKVYNVSLIPGLLRRKLYTLYLAAVLQRKATQQGTRLLIVIDEAQNILPSRIIAEAVAEARKKDTGMLIIAHSIAEIPHDVRSDINTWIIHRLVTSEDARQAAAIVGDAYAEMLTSLPTGEAVVSTPGYEEPVVTRVTPSAPCTR